MLSDHCIHPDHCALRFIVLTQIIVLSDHRAHSDHCALRSSCSFITLHLTLSDLSQVISRNSYRARPRLNRRYLPNNYYYCMGQCPSRSTSTRTSTVTVNTSEQSARARARWITAFRRVHRLLHIRRLWAHVGHYLNRPDVLTLTDGLERRKGQLIRFAAHGCWSTPTQPAALTRRARQATPRPIAAKRQQ